MMAIWLHASFAIAVPVTNDKVFIDNFVITKGSQMVVDLQLTNASLYTAFQCDVYLPEGLTCVVNEQNLPAVSMNPAYVQSHSVSGNIINDGVLRVVVISFGNVAFASEGAVVRITIQASADADGEKTIDVKNVRIVDVAQRIESVAPETQAAVKVVRAYLHATVIADNLTMVYGDEVPTLTYKTEGDGLDGLPQLTTTATSQSSVGVYPIKVEKGTVENPMTTYVDGELTIEKAPLTIIAGSYAIKQGEPMPTFEVTYIGFRNEDTEAVLTQKAKVECAATSNSAPDTYDIIVSGAEAQNYEPFYTKGILTITEADPVTVTAKSYTRQYGEANPTFEYESVGKALEGTPKIICEATETTVVGIYPIVVEKGTVKNYNDSYVNGTLTITKAPLTITANSYTIKQGEPLPAFELTYVGFKNSETDAVLTKKPTLSCAATSSSEIGTFDIRVGDAEAQNYDITSIANGTLTIEEVDPLDAAPLEWQMAEGWNWVSHNRKNALEPKALFSKNMVEMKSQTRGIIRDSRYGLVGNLTELLPTAAYKVRTTAADAEPCEIAGELFNIKNTPIELKKGWNWIGCPLYQAARIAVALKNLEPEEDDCIVGQEGLATYAEGGWKGDLTTLTPGRGYMYKSGKDNSFHYNASVEAKMRSDSNSKDIAEMAEEESIWTCNRHQYPNMMPVIAALRDGHTEVDMEHYSVAAFCGDECRGVGKVVNARVMMNVCGEGGEVITFKALDKKTGIIIDINADVVFTGDMLGTYTSPYQLQMDEEAMSIEEWTAEKMEKDNSDWYTLDGRKLNGSLLEKGVYIHQGKKVLVE